MRSSIPVCAAFGIFVLAAGCATTGEDPLGDLSDPDSGTSDNGNNSDSDSGSTGSLGNGSGNGNSGGSTDAGKSSADASHGNDAATTSGTDAGTTTTSSGGGTPTTCTQADGQIGCCGAGGTLYYCNSSNKLTTQTCTGGNVCGWSSSGYYDCVASPGGADPSGTSPMACAGGTTSSTDAGTTTTDAGSSVTWTTIYNTVFGPSGTSGCSGSSCHSSSRSGFTCGSSKTTCYNGFVNAGYITPGASASSSALVDPAQSPLCGTTLGGNMPIGNSCVTAAQITTIKAWLAAGAPNN